MGLNKSPPEVVNKDLVLSGPLVVQSKTQKEVKTTNITLNSKAPPGKTPTRKDQKKISKNKSRNIRVTPSLRSYFKVQAKQSPTKELNHLPELNSGPIVSEDSLPNLQQPPNITIRG